MSNQQTRKDAKGKMKGVKHPGEDHPEKKHNEESGKFRFQNAWPVPF